MPSQTDVLWSGELLLLSAHYGVTQQRVIMWVYETGQKTEKLLIEEELKKEREEQTDTDGPWCLSTEAWQTLSAATLISNTMTGPSKAHIMQRNKNEEDWINLHTRRKYNHSFHSGMWIWIGSICDVCFVDWKHYRYEGRVMITSAPWWTTSCSYIMQ